jgi:hypothetical protein
MPDPEIRKFNPDEARDYHGRWTEGGGDGTPDIHGSTATTAPSLDVHASVREYESKYVEMKTEIGQAWRSDGSSIFSGDGLVGNESSVFLSPDESKLLRDNPGSIFTHFHPSGHTLSMADIRFASFNNLGEVRAIGKNFIYSMKPGSSGAWPDIPTVVASYDKARAWVEKNVMRYYSGPDKPGHYTDEINAQFAFLTGLNYTKESRG